MRGYRNNPGPTLKNIIQTFIPIQKKTYKNYFYQNTAKLKNEYQHIAKPFIPHIDNKHPQHTTKIVSHPKLTQLCISQSMFPSENIIFSIIIILAPSPDLCEITITNQNTQNFQQTLHKLQNTPNNGQKHYGIEHVLQNFKKLHKDLCEIPKTINKEIYNIIITIPNINSQILQDKYPTLPSTLIKNPRMSQTTIWV